MTTPPLQPKRFLLFIAFTLLLALALPFLLSTVTNKASAKSAGTTLAAIGDYPIIPTIDAAMKTRLRTILAEGATQGNHPDVFAKVGDSISQEGYFLWGVGCSTEKLGAYTALATTITYFRSRTFPASYLSPFSFCPPTSNAFTRNSASAIYGGASNRALEAWPDASHPECNAGEIALHCELRLMKPSIALIMYGTNDLYYYNDLPLFRANLTRIVTETLALGVIPVISTIPPRLDSLNGTPLGTRVEPYNQVIVEVAAAQQIPLWNYWRSLQDPNLVDQGINSQDLVHPNVYPSPSIGVDGSDFTAEGLRYGYNLRGLNALQILAKLKQIVLDDGAPDGLPAVSTATATAATSSTPLSTATPTPTASATATSNTPAPTTATPVPSATATPVATVAPIVLYSEKIVRPWADWSYGGFNNHDENTTPFHAGVHSLAVTITGGWSALQLGYADMPQRLDISRYDTLRFWIHGGSTGGQKLTVSIGCFTLADEVVAQANQWVQVDLPLFMMGKQRTLAAVAWFNNSPNPVATFYLDDIMLISGGSSAPNVSTVVGPALSVDVNADEHPISPYIYGIDSAAESLAAELQLPVRRWGGNSTSRYNWQLDVHNTGSDYYFENIPDENPHPENLPHGSLADRFVEQDRRTASKTILTIPLTGWTPKRRLAAHPYDCSFKISKYGAQDSFDNPWDVDCGSGSLNQIALTGNDPHDTSVEISSTFAISWINHLTAKYGTAANGGVMFYSLDNEPMLWNSTHRDVHPQNTTYDEMRDRTYTYAAAIKAADPTAKTLGPVVWGWCAYFYSAADGDPANNTQGCAPGVDYKAHGNTGFVEWYLQQMRQYEETKQTRLLDYLDVHIYPQSTQTGYSPYRSCPGNAAEQALRLRSTRALWDATYTDESWIAQPVRLLPRMKEWVSNNYTGTKLAISEYNWGAPEYINGAVAQADVLGIFGREGLDLATFWNQVPNHTIEPDDAVMYAFRLYRNYNGKGAGFGETSVRAQSGDQGKLAIYAARRSSDEAITLMVINKSTEHLTSNVTISDLTGSSTAQVYRYDEGNLAAIVRQPNLTVSASGLAATFPASSITLVVILPAGVSDDRSVYLPTIQRNR